jgi:hypothetical protein
MVKHHSVTFDSNPIKAHDSPYDEEDIEERWYSKIELKKLRSDTLGLVREEISNSKRYASAIRSTYKACNKADASTTSAVLNIVQRDTRWVATDPSLLGLDKYIKCSAQQRHRYHSDAVLRVQQMQFDESSEQAHWLDYKSREYSRGSRLYARIIAQAQFGLDVYAEESAAQVGRLPKIGRGLRWPLQSLVARSMVRNDHEPDFGGESTRQ